MINLEFPIPSAITVHLGAPDDSSAPNVTVPFAEYIKNVASSEIYPTWPENAIRANIYAQITYALNRVFTEHYPSRGFSFDITNNTRYDQSFVNGRDIFENISQIVDEVFNNYIGRAGEFGPIFAQYCNGTTTTCPGLSQWGTVDLANQGYTPYEILQYYYGDDIIIIQNAPVEDIRYSYPGTPLRLGDVSKNVRRIGLQLNVISRNYPSIPKIDVTDAFDVDTENAVREFQRNFNLTQDGIVGKATWYKINQISNAVLRLSELDSRGISLENITRDFVGPTTEGATGLEVQLIQYYLAFISEFNNFIPPVSVDGIYGPATAVSVRAFQQSEGLPQTGAVNRATWDALYSRYASIVAALPADYRPRGGAPFPGVNLRRGMSGPSITTMQTYLSTIADAYPSVPKITPTGYFGVETQNAILAFEREFGLPQRAIVGPLTWDAIVEQYVIVRDGRERSFGQYPGTEIGEAAQ